MKSLLKRLIIHFVCAEQDNYRPKRCLNFKQEAGLFKLLAAQITDGHTSELNLGFIL
jgi:hypothetical protein